MYQSNTLYTLNLSVMCQLYLNKKKILSEKDWFLNTQQKAFFAPKLISEHAQYIN